MNESNSTDGRNVSQASTENKSEKKNQEDSANDDKREGDDKRIIEEKLWVANSMPNEEEEISQMLIELQGIVRIYEIKNDIKMYIQIKYSRKSSFEYRLKI